MAKHAPSRRNLELGQQVEQPVDDLGALPFDRPPERVRAVVPERPPDQLEVEAEREDAAVQAPTGPPSPRACWRDRASRGDRQAIGRRAPSGAGTPEASGARAARPS